MAVSNQEIQNWLAANPTASDATIAKAMDQYGVTPAQMASATGMDVGAVQSRYDAATGANTGATTQTGNVATTQQQALPTAVRQIYSTGDIQKWLAANPRATDAQIAQAMNKYNVSPSQMATATGLSLADVQNRYNAASPTGQYFVKPTTTTTTTQTPITQTQNTGINTLMGGTGAGTGSSMNLPPYSQVNQQQGIAEIGRAHV